MHKTDRSEHARPAVGPRLDGRVRALREGEVMGAYMDFDRTADRAWTPAEYLVRFGEYVSQRTAEVNNGERPAWRFVGLAGCKPYLTQRQYEAQTPGMQQWYEPLPAAGDERSNMDVVCILEQATYKPGDLPPATGYLAWHEWAEVQRKAGIKQRQCGKCGKWKTPQEMSKNHVQCETSREHGLVIVAYLSPFPLCTQCEDSFKIPSRQAQSQP